MKKKLLALLAACAAGPALAQTSVQIYGVADAGVLWQRGQPVGIISGGADGSRLGFKGSEELGRGYKAIFDLEARVQLDTGRQQTPLVNDNQGYWLTHGMDSLPPQVLQQVRTATQPPGVSGANPGNALFDRTSMVGLITPFGAGMFGRLYTPGYEVFVKADAFEAGTVGTWSSILGGSAVGFTAIPQDIRSSKAFGYRINGPYGLGGALMVASKGSGFLEQYSKFWGVNITYTADGWDVGLATNRGYDQSDNPSLRTSTVGGSFRWREWKFFLGVHDQKDYHPVSKQIFTNLWDSQIAPTLGQFTPLAAAEMRNVFLNNMINNTKVDAISYQAGVHWYYGPGRVMASAAYTKDRSPSASNLALFAIGYDYFLSKRTDLYAVGSYLRNDGVAQFSPALADAAGGFTAKPGESGHAVLIGMRHRF